MNDRELLELAAKAAGVELDWDIPPNSRNPWRMIGEGDERGPAAEWNPITDDGDALRLAVKLNMGISIPVHRTIRADVVCFRDSAISAKEEGNDPYAATRRAIVRAAAEIGKGMK